MAILWWVLKLLGILLGILVGILVVILVLPVGGRIEWAGGKLYTYIKVGPIKIRFPRESQQEKKEATSQSKSDDLVPQETLIAPQPPETGEKPIQVLELPQESGAARPEKLPEPPTVQPETETKSPPETISEAEDETAKKPPESGAGKQPEKKKKRSKSSAESSSSTEPKKKPAEETLASITLWEKIRAALGLAGPLLGRLFNGIHLTDIQLRFWVHQGDAAKTAITYGRISGLVYGTLALLRELCGKAEVTQLELEPDFTGEYKGQEYFSCNVTTQLYIIAAIGIWALVQFKRRKII